MVHHVKSQLLYLQMSMLQVNSLTLIRTNGPDLDLNSLALIWTNGPNLDPNSLTLIWTNGPDLDPNSLALKWTNGSDLDLELVVCFYVCCIYLYKIL